MIYSLPIRTLANADGRYPTADEERAVLEWATSVPRRLQAVNLIAQKESIMVSEAIEYMKPRYPRFGLQHERAYEKGERDLQLCLRYAAQGIAMDDPNMPLEKVYYWYRTIIRSLGLTPEFTRESCQALYDSCKKHLPAEVFALAAPYLQRMVDDVSEFPEPDRPAVN